MDKYDFCYTLIKIKTIIFDLLFPVSCAICRKEGTILCASCCLLLPQMPPSCMICHIAMPGSGKKITGATCKSCRKKTPVRVFLSPFRYHHPIVMQLVHDFKYRRIRDISPIAASLIVSYVRYYQITLPKDAVIVPIPLHRARRRVRGFNQALLLSKDIARDVALPFLSAVLIRIAATKPQAKLTAQYRQYNVENIFSVTDLIAVQKKTVILIDDVKTTGATLNQAAYALKKAGAKEIWAITFAH